MDLGLQHFWVCAHVSWAERALKHLLSELLHSLCVLKLGGVAARPEDHLLEPVRTLVEPSGPVVPACPSLDVVSIDLRRGDILDALLEVEVHVGVDGFPEVQHDFPRIVIVLQLAEVGDLVFEFGVSKLKCLFSVDFVLQFLSESCIKEVFWRVFVHREFIISILQVLVV